MDGNSRGYDDRKDIRGKAFNEPFDQAGYGQFVASDLNGYVDLAVEWANRLDELAAIRAEMRERVRKSPLCDAPRFAQDFLVLLNQAWIGQKP